jgi:hypothetical protein
MAAQNCFDVAFAIYTGGATLAATVGPRVIADYAVWEQNGLIKALHDIGAPGLVTLGTPSPMQGGVRYTCQVNHKNGISGWVIGYYFPTGRTEFASFVVDGAPQGTNSSEACKQFPELC